MPLYRYQCPDCGHACDEFRSIAARHDGPTCHGCQRDMELRIMPTAVHADLPGYQSPIDGRWIEGRAARNEDLKRNGCRPWEGLATEQAEAAKAREAADAQLERTLEAGAHAVLNGMDRAKQDALKNGTV